MGVIATPTLIMSTFFFNCCIPTGLHFLFLLEFYLCINLKVYGAGAGLATEDLDC